MNKCFEIKGGPNCTQSTANDQNGIASKGLMPDSFYRPYFIHVLITNMSIIFKMLLLRFSTSTKVRAINQTMNLLPTDCRFKQSVFHICADHRNIENVNSTEDP